MKMVKKILFGLVAVAAVLSLASCGIKKDDPEGIIKGTAGNYSVNYKYEGDSTDTYRAYKPTGFQHAGALVKVTFDQGYVTTAKAGNSKFGLIFGLKETKSGDQNIRDFYIVGLGATGQYYVSKFDHIVNIQAPNFGAPEEYDEDGVSSTGTNGEIETEIKPITAITLEEDDDGNKYAYIWYQAWTDGTYHIRIGNITDTNVSAWKQKDDASMKNQAPDFETGYIECIIPQTTTQITPWTAANAKAPQGYAAVYARVQGNTTLNGTVKFQKDFKEAEDIEPID